MLVVIIIGVLAAMVVPRFAGRTEQAKVTRAKSDIAAIGLALDMYELDMGQYPMSMDELLVNNNAGTAPDGENNWKGPYLKKGKPKDPWGRDYVYERDGDSYKLSSFGADGQPGKDDIKSWE